MESTQSPQPQIPLQAPPQSVEPRSKLPMVAIAVFVLGVLLYVILGKNATNQGENLYNDVGGNNYTQNAVVSETTEVNGFLSAPPGLPSDIPIESSDIVESSTTNFPGQNSSQLSVNYRSSKTVAEKYAEYKTYLTNAGYKITEGSSTAKVRAIFGTKVDANLSVAISTSNGKTLVQLSYLLK